MLHSSTTSLDLGTLEPKCLLVRIPDLNRNIIVFLQIKSNCFIHSFFSMKTISLVKTKAALILKLAVVFFGYFCTFKAEYSKF